MKSRRRGRVGRECRDCIPAYVATPLRGGSDFTRLGGNPPRTDIACELLIGKQSIKAQPDNRFSGEQIAEN